MKPHSVREVSLKWFCKSTIISHTLTDHQDTSGPIVYRVGVAQGKVQYLAKHLKGDNKDTANRSAVRWQKSLRGMKVHISIFLPLFVYFFVSLPAFKLSHVLLSVPTLYSNSSRFLLPLDVTVFGKCRWKWIKTKILFSVGYWKENTCSPLEMAYFLSVFSPCLCSLVFLSVAPQRICYMTLWALQRGPYSQCKHVRAKSQGDSLSKVSQGQCCLKQRTHTLSCNNAELLVYSCSHHRWTYWIFRQMRFKRIPAVVFYSLVVQGSEAGHVRAMNSK